MAIESINFAGVETSIDEVVCILLTTSDKPTEEERIDEAFRWLERRLQVGRFAGGTSVDTEQRDPFYVAIDETLTGTVREALCPPNTPKNPSKIIKYRQRMRE